MAIWQYALTVIPRVNAPAMYNSDEAVWRSVHFNEEALLPKIDLLVPRAGWDTPKCYAWKGREDREQGNDCCIFLSEKAGVAEEFSFRIDLHNKENLDHFLKGMLALCRENDFMLLNEKNELLEPDEETVLQDIRLSNAFSFLSDPPKFLDNLSLQENDNEAT